MPYREQPMDLVHAPPQWPSHNYVGAGRWITCRTATGSHGVDVGTLSAGQPGTLCWFSDRGPTAGAAYHLRVAIEGLLRAALASRTTADAAWDMVAATTPHTEPQSGDLADLRRHLTS